MDATERVHTRISQLESELAKCRAQSEAQVIEVEAAAEALERQYLAQDAVLRQIQQQNEASALEAAATLQELKNEKDARSKLEQQLKVKSSELEDAQLKSELLKQQRVSLLDQLEQRKVEQQELKAALDSYVSKTTSLLEEKLQAERKADEAQLERMRSHGEHSKLQQRITHLEEQVSFLESENTSKSRSLLEAQRQAAQEQLASSRQVADLQAQLESKTGHVDYLNRLLESKQKLLEEAQAGRLQADQAAASEKLLLEGQLAAEKEAVATVRELYEAKRERCQTLESTLLQLQTQVEEASSAQCEALEKAEAARQAAEDLAEKCRQQLEQLASASAAAGSPTAGSPVTPGFQLAPPRARTLRPDPELRVVPLHEGLTVQELYSEYMEMACVYQNEVAKSRSLQHYMDSVCEQLEGRAAALQRQQEAYNRAMQEREQLAASVQTLQDEQRLLEAQAAQAVAQLDTVNRRAVALEQQNEDTSRQVEVLLAEMERLHGRPVPAVSRAPRTSPGVISAQDIINDKLVAFNSMPDMLEQHRQMRNMIRSLVEEMETTRSSAREHADQLVAEKQAALDAALTNVVAERQQLQQALEVVAGQQDHYKQALADATGEIEKLRGNTGGQEAGRDGVSSTRLALEGPPSASARQELESLRQQLEAAKHSASQEVADLRQQLLGNQGQLAEVKAMLAAATAAQQHGEARIEDLKGHLEVLKQQRLENLQERQRLQHSLNVTEGRLREAQAAQADKAEELFRAKTTISELEQEVSRERRAESEASQKLVKLHLESRNEAVELRYQLGLAAARQEALSCQAKEAKERVIGLEAEVGRLNGELLAEKGKLSSLKESDVMRIQSSFGLVKQFKEENSTMRAQMEEFESKLKVQAAEREELQKAHDRLQAKVGLLERELQENKDKIFSLTSEHAQLTRTQQEEIEQLKLEVKSKVEVAELSKKQLEAARQEVTFYQLAASTAGSDVITIKAELEARNADLADVRTCLEAVQKATAEAQETMSKLREDKQAAERALQDELSQVKLRLQSTQQQLEARESELKEAKQQLEFANASHQLDKEALQQAHDRAQTAERQISELAAALDAAKKQRDDLQDKVTLSEQAHTSEVVSLQKTVQDLQLQAATLKLQSEKVTQDVLEEVTDDTVRQTMEFLKQQQQLTEERVQALTDEREKLALEKEAALREAMEARAQVRNLEELSKNSIAPKVHRQQLDEVEARVRALREEVIDVKAELQDAQTKEAAARATGEIKQAEIDTLNHQISTLQSSLRELQDVKTVHEDLSKQWEARIEQLRGKTNCVEKSEFEKVSQELEMAKKQLSALEGRKANMALVKNLQKQLSEIRAKHMQEFNEEKRKAAQKNNEVIRKLNSSIATIRELRKELLESKKTTTSLEQQLAQQQSQDEQLTQQQQAHQQQLEARLKELSEARATESVLRTQLRAAQEHLTQANKRVDDLRAEVAKAVADGAAKAAEISQLRCTVDAAQKEKSVTLQSQAQMAGEIRSLKGEKEALQQQLQNKTPPPVAASLPQAAPPSATPPTATTMQPPLSIPPPACMPSTPAAPPAAAVQSAPKIVPPSSSQTQKIMLPHHAPEPSQPLAARPLSAAIVAKGATGHPPAAVSASAITTLLALPPSVAVPKPVAPPAPQPTGTAPAAPTTAQPVAPTPSIPPAKPDAKPDAKDGLSTSTPQASPATAPSWVPNTQPPAEQPPRPPPPAPPANAANATASTATTLSQPLATTSSPPASPAMPHRPVPTDTEAQAAQQAQPAPSPPASRRAVLRPMADLESMSDRLKRALAAKLASSKAGITGSDSAARPAGQSLSRSASNTQQPSPGIKRTRTESAEGAEAAEPAGAAPVATAAVAIATATLLSRQSIKRQKGLDGESTAAASRSNPPCKVPPELAAGLDAVLVSRPAHEGISVAAEVPAVTVPLMALPPLGTGERGEPGTATRAEAQEQGAGVDVEMKEATKGPEDEREGFVPRRLFDGPAKGASAHRLEDAPEALGGVGELPVEDTSMQVEQDNAASQQGPTRIPSVTAGLQKEEDDEQYPLDADDEDVIEIEDSGDMEATEEQLQEDAETEAGGQLLQAGQPAAEQPASFAPLAATSPNDGPIPTPLQTTPLFAPTTNIPPVHVHAHPSTSQPPPSQLDNSLAGHTIDPSHVDSPAHAAGPPALTSTRAETAQRGLDENASISQQSMDQFTALHHLTLQLDAQNVSVHGQQLLGNITEGMPPYDKPLIFSGGDVAQAGSLSTEAAALESLPMLTPAGAAAIAPAAGAVPAEAPIDTADVTFDVPPVVMAPTPHLVTPPAVSEVIQLTPPAAAVTPAAAGLIPPAQPTFLLATNVVVPSLPPTVTSLSPNADPFFPGHLTGDSGPAVVFSHPAARSVAPQEEQTMPAGIPSMGPVSHVPDDIASDEVDMSGANEEEQLLGSPIDFRLDGEGEGEGEEPAGDFITDTVDLGDDEEEEGDDIMAEEGEIDMDDVFDQDADVITVPGDSTLEEEEEAEDGGDDEELDEADSQGEDKVGDDNRSKPEAGTSLPPSVAVSRAVSQDFANHQPANHPATHPSTSDPSMGHAPLTPQDLNANPSAGMHAVTHPNTNPSANPSTEGVQGHSSRLVTSPTLGGPEPRTSSASGIGAVGPAHNNEEDGGGDGGDDNEHTSRDQGGRRPRRQIQFSLGPRSTTDPPAIPAAAAGPSAGEGGPRAHGNPPAIGGRGPQGLQHLLRGGLMGRRGRGRLSKRGGRGAS